MSDLRIGTYLSGMLFVLISSSLVLSLLETKVAIVSDVLLIVVSVNALLLAVFLLLEIIGYYVEVFIDLT